MASPCTGCPLSLACTKRHIFSSEINKQLKPLNKLDNYHVFLAVAEDLIIIGFAIGLFLFSPWFYPLTLLVIGSRQRALATLLHESSHRTLAKNKTLNFLAGTVFSGYWILQMFHTYRCSHVLLHHRYLGDPDRDPDIRYYIEQGLMDQNVDRTFLVKMIVKNIFGLRTFTYLKYLFLHRLLPLNWAEKTNMEKLEYIGFVTFWLIIVTFLTYFNLLGLFFLVWLVPYLTTFQIIGWFIELAEHYPLTRNNSYDLYMSRNRYSNPIEKFFTGMHNENWHLLHHIRAGIPYWNLPKAHEILMQDPEYAKTSRLSGGLFMRGTNNAPSIISSMLEQLNGTPNVKNHITYTSSSFHN